MNEIKTYLLSLDPKVWYWVIAIVLGMTILWPVVRFILRLNAVFRVILILGGLGLFGTFSSCSKTPGSQSSALSAVQAAFVR